MTNRREFFKKSAMAVAAVAVAPFCDRIDGKADYLPMQKIIYFPRILGEFFMGYDYQ